MSSVAEEASQQLSSFILHYLLSNSDLEKTYTTTTSVGMYMYMTVTFIHVQKAGGMFETDCGN